MKKDIIPHKFIADVMLGKFSKKLRLLGVDVKYFPDIDDISLIKIALRENRILLTCDKKLSERSVLKNRVFYIRHVPLEEKLTEFLNTFGNVIKISPFSRCIECNGELVEIEKERVIKYVPPYIFRNHNYFKICTSCGKIFWKGTHFERMKEWLDSLLKN